MDTEATNERLREMVKRYRVSWRVYPESVTTRDHHIPQVGFQLGLRGVHAPGSHPAPGCDLCREVYAALEEITAWILPHEKRQSTYDMLSFDSSLHYDLNPRAPAYVELTILIRHRENYESPVDECEMRCLGEMEERLRELGASRATATSGLRTAVGKRQAG